MIPETIIWYFCVKPEHKKGKYGFTFCSDNDENIGLDIFDNALQIYPRPGQVDKMLMVLKVWGLNLLDMKIMDNLSKS